MKVLQVNCVYGKGSTGKITQDIHKELCARGMESIVCYGRGERIREPGVYKPAENCIPNATTCCPDSPGSCTAAAIFPPTG